MKKTTVAVLLYGDHPDLAERCLAPLTTWHRCLLADLRILCNDISDRTRKVLQDLKLEDAVESYAGPERAKYPAMRSLLHSPRKPLCGNFCWFDDDSFIPGDAEKFLQTFETKMAEVDAMGQFWSIPLRGNQHQWIQDQPWYTGKRVERMQKVRFFQGGWWCVKTALLWKNDWPSKELERKGGDVMMGELMRQQDWKVFDVGRDFGVRINANNPEGKHSVGPTRGPMPLPDPIGVHYKRPTHAS